MDPIDQQILDALVEAQQEDEEGLFAFYEQLLRLIATHKATLSLTREALFHPRQLHDWRQSRHPYLHFSALEVDPTPFLGWFQRVALLFEQREEGVLEEVEALDAAACWQLAEQWLEQGKSGQGPLIDSLLANALAPYLERAATLLLPALPLTQWGLPYCPLCGGYPDFALWDEATEGRQLLCERCRTPWTVEEEGCLFCGEDDPQQRGLYLSEDERYRVEVCDSCGYYLKGMAQQRQQTSLLAAERLLTPGLDLLAAQEGFTRPTGRGDKEESDEQT